MNSTDINLLVTHYAGLIRQRSYADLINTQFFHAPFENGCQLNPLQRELKNIWSSPIRKKVKIIIFRYSLRKFCIKVLKKGNQTFFSNPQLTQGQPNSPHISQIFTMYLDHYVGQDESRIIEVRSTAQIASGREAKLWTDQAECGLVILMRGMEAKKREHQIQRCFFLSLIHQSTVGTLFENTLAQMRCSLKQITKNGTIEVFLAGNEVSREAYKQALAIIVDQQKIYSIEIKDSSFNHKNMGKFTVKYNQNIYKGKFTVVNIGFNSIYQPYQILDVSAID